MLSAILFNGATVFALEVGYFDLRLSKPGRDLWGPHLTNRIPADFSFSTIWKRLAGSHHPGSSFLGYIVCRTMIPNAWDAVAAPKPQAQLSATPSTSAQAPEVFHWINIFIS